MRKPRPIDYERARVQKLEAEIRRLEKELEHLRGTHLLGSLAGIPGTVENVSERPALTSPLPQFGGISKPVI